MTVADKSLRSITQLFSSVWEHWEVCLLMSMHDIIGDCKASGDMRWAYNVCFLHIRKCCRREGAGIFWVGEIRISTVLVFMCTLCAFSQMSPLILKLDTKGARFPTEPLSTTRSPRIVSETVWTCNRWRLFWLKDICRLLCPVTLLESRPLSTLTNERVNKACNSVKDAVPYLEVARRFRARVFRKEFSYKSA